MFMFSLTLQSKYYSNYNSLNIWINTMSNYDDIIDFGWGNALQFESRVGGQGQVTYRVNSDFISPPTVSAMTGSSGYVSLVSFEVYQAQF